MDKVKAQAEVGLAKATEAGKVGLAKAGEASAAGMAKLDDAQAKRRADQLLRQLGLAAYRERTGAPSDGPAGAVDVDAVVEELRALEAEHGPIDG
jgi:hypothetical protein